MTVWHMICNELQIMLHIMHNSVDIKAMAKIYSAVQTCTHTKKSKQNSNDHSDWQGREDGPGEMTALPFCVVTVPFPDVGQTQSPLTCPL